MITRREAVLGLGVAALGSMAPSAFGFLEPLRPVLPEANRAASAAEAGKDSVDERLSKALAQKASRANSEEGVPVFLACINQVAGESVPQARQTALSTDVAAAMRENAAAWQRIRPNAAASDVAKLIEVVAERDFMASETRHKA